MKSKKQNTDQPNRKGGQRRSPKNPGYASIRDAYGKPLSGVGRKIGLAFVEAYFPEATNTIRIATAYFQLKGYKIARPHIRQGVRLHILVGREEGQHVQAAVIDEIIAELGDCTTDIWSAVADLVVQMRGGSFFIRDARELRPPFHAKFYICDEKLVWHGSTNFSDRGLKVAREQASIIRSPEEVQTFTEWFDETIPQAQDLLEELIGQLEKWLKLATPFEVYLKTILSLNDLPDQALDIGAHYPTYFQKGIIVQALRQIAAFDGALIVAATGLGKTIVGAEIASRLRNDRRIKRVLLLAPQSVHSQWKDECEGRGLDVKMFDTSILFRQQSSVSHHQISQLEQELRRASPELLILVDEAHVYRNQLIKEQLSDAKSIVYRRLGNAVKAGAKIILLTATAYGTNTQNFNSLLYLLPSRDRTRSHKFTAWSASTPSTFTKLPIVTILGLPHIISMARERDDVHENGRVFIQLVDEQRYLPKKIMLHPHRYNLYLTSELQSAFNASCFHQSKSISYDTFDEEAENVRVGRTNGVYNISLRSWLSSPPAMQATIERNLRTSGKRDTGKQQQLELPLLFDLHIVNNNSTDESDPPTQPYKVVMRLDQSVRTERLTPILQQLKQLQITDDDKFVQLRSIIEEHCLHTHGKVLIFVNRHLTARYLVDALVETFGGFVRVGCTIDAGTSRPQLKPVHQRAEELKKFSPHSHNVEVSEEYQVLICTDADGIGVNLQDANTLVNYDLPEGADEIFQRAGRILRMTHDPDRIVHIYTFVPRLLDQQHVRSDVQNRIWSLFDQITKRHDKSRQVLGAGVLAANERTEIVLDNEFDVVQLARDSGLVDDIGGLGAESMLRHTALLEQYRDRSFTLPPYPLSARSYTKSEWRMFVLLIHDQVPYPIVYNISEKVLERHEDFEVLDLIACNEKEQRATVNAEAVEHFANYAVQVWCKQNSIPIDKAQKVCALCLVPPEKAEELTNIFKDAQRLQDENFESV